ncbi:hypothetical protein TwortDSMZ_092 [Staphylococcus phage Twort]|uniref:Uncharacterized protein n=2 Tax=Staphylococcus phage Twort (strain DSM 17442 / HER 48) TaxID=2908167 RepID=A0A6H0X5G6_BPTWO|nr:portal protein [Staphylococcus phage Twort]AAX92410.1 ORF121 [Staphylococcus phage Twort]QIW89092.1 hypothetical protein TwortDSMZ_092 [Staphylococcus phage Twort]
MTYAKDKKWEDAKTFIKQQGMKDNWIEIVDYYRQIGGTHVAVFIALEKEKYMILEATTDNRVILVDKNNNIVLEDYNVVMESKKMFYYIEQPFKHKIDLNSSISSITYNNTDTLTMYNHKDGDTVG